jgi:hypothetical protein
MTSFDIFIEKIIKLKEFGFYHMKNNPWNFLMQHVIPSEH